MVSSSWRIMTSPQVIRYEDIASFSIHQARKRPDIKAAEFFNTTRCEHHPHFCRFNNRGERVCDHRRWCTGHRTPPESRALPGKHPNSRANLISTKPGQVLNPAGRPKGSRNIRTILDEMLTALFNWMARDRRQ